MSELLSVSDALSHILSGVEPTPTELLDLSRARDRVLSSSLSARRTQPPFAASAMDGYAVCSADITQPPFTLTCIGVSSAGHGYKGEVASGETVRIFTGAPLPSGTDTILIQEHAKADKTDGDKITFTKQAEHGSYVRPAAIDFQEGDELIQSFTTLHPSALSLAASMNHKTVEVQKRPIVSIIATGDELVCPGDDLGEDQIVSSNAYGVAALIEKSGGESLDLGIAKDNLESLEEKFNLAASHNSDIVVTLGGASVGDHDLVKESLIARGIELDFWKLAMRPGKPVMFGRSESCRYLGLPGNPVSSLVCTQIFVCSLIRALLGLDSGLPRISAYLGCDLPANDEREEYMRAESIYTDSGRFVTPFTSQDSSLLSLYHRADCLLIRPSNAQKMAKGDLCEIIEL